MAWTASLQTLTIYTMDPRYIQRHASTAKSVKDEHGSEFSRHYILQYWSLQITVAQAHSFTVCLIDGSTYSTSHNLPKSIVFSMQIFPYSRLCLCAVYRINPSFTILICMSVSFNSSILFNTIWVWWYSIWCPVRDAGQKFGRLNVILLSFRSLCEFYGFINNDDIEKVCCILKQYVICCFYFLRRV
jgi:hypothetical protein